MSRTLKTTRTCIGLIAALLVVALTTYWMHQQPPEDPLIKGVPLSQWLERQDWILGWPPVSPPIQPEDVRAVASKAAPFLAYYLRHNQPRHQNAITERTTSWLQSKLPPSWVSPKADGGCERALVALGWLGADAEPALPTLISFVNNPDGGLKYNTADVIHRMGPVSWPAVFKIWHGGSLQSRYSIIHGLPSRLGSPTVTEADKKRTIDLLLEACRDPDPWIQYIAIDTLNRCRMSSLGASPLFDPAIPVIIRSMETGKGSVPLVAARTLSQFPEHARTIIPALKKLESSSNPEYSKAAKQALESIEKQKPKEE